MLSNNQPSLQPSEHSEFLLFTGNQRTRWYNRESLSWPILETKNKPMQPAKKQWKTKAGAKKNVFAEIRRSFVATCKGCRRQKQPTEPLVKLMGTNPHPGLAMAHLSPKASSQCKMVVLAARHAEKATIMPTKAQVSADVSKEPSKKQWQHNIGENPVARRTRYCCTKE